MIKNPVKYAVKSGIVFVAILGTVLLWILVAIYGNSSVGKAFLLSFLYILAQIFGFYFFQATVRVVKKRGIKLLLIVMIQIVLLLAIFVINWLLGTVSIKQFVETIPLISIFGIMFFGILVLWYDIKKHKKEDDEEENESLKAASKNVQNVQASKEAEIDRISVKQGSDLNILKTNEIFYIEAYGDYVLIYTETGKFIKEQTMYYFEAVLPSQFVRIHRSYIVNTDFMIRLELFGKESYNIRLKNGVTIKASKTGYKLLKNRIGL